MGILGLSLRYLRTRRIALVAVFSIAVGVLAMIVVVSLMDGVLAFVRSHFQGTESDVEIQAVPHAGGLGVRWAEVSEALEPEMVGQGGPILALSPRVVWQSLIAPGDDPGPEQEDLIQGVRIVGVDWKLERSVTPLDAMLDAVERDDLRVPAASRDDPLAASDPPPILLGDSLAKALGVSRLPGADLVTLVAGRSKMDAEGHPTFEGEARSRIFRVAGCFTTGREDFDIAHVLLSRFEALRMKSDRPETISDFYSVHARLRDPSRVGEVVAGLRERHGGRLAFTSWQERRNQELLALDDQKRIMVVILSFIILVAGVAILGIVYLMVVEKTRDIGILRSLGLSRVRLVAVFTAYGAMLGMIGCVIGILAGLQVTANLDAIVTWLSRRLDVQLLDPRIYRFKSVPTNVQASSVAMIGAVAFAVSLVASLVPALRAALLPPVRALRSE
jgi:lipoprotein-releasing system permease protein